MPCIAYYSWCLRKEQLLNQYQNMLRILEVHLSKTIWNILKLSFDMLQQSLTNMPLPPLPISDTKWHQTQQGPCWAQRGFPSLVSSHRKCPLGSPGRILNLYESLHISTDLFWSWIGSLQPESSHVENWLTSIKRSFSDPVVGLARAVGDTHLSLFKTMKHMFGWLINHEICGWSVFKIIFNVTRLFQASCRFLCEKMALVS